jgi:type III restriction enzyme
MSDRVSTQIRQRLSLRAPQEEALDILTKLVKEVDLVSDHELSNKLDKVNKLYPTCIDFERDFVSVCFALATGVGKTRLMGAFISYLYLSKGVPQFLCSCSEYDDLQEAHRRFGQSCTSQIRL